MKNRTIYLSPAQAAQPMAAVQAFFNAANLPQHLKMLKQWRNLAAFKRRAKPNSSPTMVLSNHELILKLLEAAWLLKNQKLGKVNLAPKRDSESAHSYLNTERQQLPHYPKNLGTKEMLRPNRVLKKTFKRHKLKAYRYILKIWLYDALSSSFMEESLSKAQVIGVYEQLVKLFEAMWLINARFKE